MASPDRFPLQPSAIARHVAVENCAQFHRYEFDSDARSAARERKEWTEAFEPLRLLLAADGREFEQETVATLRSMVHSHTDYSDTVDGDRGAPGSGGVESARGQWDDPTRTDLIERFEEALALDDDRPPVMLTEAPLGGSIGVWPVFGLADIILIWPETDDHLRIRVFEMKASTDEQTYHQIQVAAYARLLRQFIIGLNPSFTATVEGGVITQSTELTGISPGDLPKFDIESREMDLQSMLAEGGEFAELAGLTGEKAPHQLGPKCMSCPYREVCYTDAVEANDIRLIGLSTREQEIFREAGVETVQDMASMAYPETPRPYEYESLDTKRSSPYSDLETDPIVGHNLDEYIQRAQALLSEITPSHPFAASQSEPTWIAGSGRPDLPDDDPPESFGEPEVKRRSLVRVYLHVSTDHRRDCLAGVGGYITCSRYADSEDPVTFAELYDSVPDRDGEANIERNLLDRVSRQIVDGVRHITETLEDSSLPVHFYLYTAHQRTKLSEALKRHDDNERIAALRELLDLRDGVDAHRSDQPMVSIIEQEIQRHLAPSSPTTGLLAMVDEFSPLEDRFQITDWSRRRSDGQKVNLRDTFNYRFFNFVVPRAGTGEDIELLVDDPDDFYPSRVRSGAQFPLEYIWAAVGNFGRDYVDDLTEVGQYESIDRYLWHDPSKQEIPIEQEDVEGLLWRLAHCTAHVERGLLSNAAMTKQELPATDLSEFDSGDMQLARSAMEFLDLEYHTRRREKLEYMSGDLRERVRGGESTLLQVTDVGVDDDDNLRVEGILLYDQLFPDGGDEVAQACRIKGNRGSTSGTWMVANRYTAHGEAILDEDPETLEKGFPVAVTELDVEDRHIAFQALPLPHTGNKKYDVWHRRWTLEDIDGDEKFETPVREDDLLVLDPRTDSLPARRTRKVLANGPDGTLCRLFEQMLAGEVTTAETDLFDPSGVSTFLEWFAGESPFEPNEQQRAFIQQIDAQIAVLQGPPGTGKTDGALAPAIAARVHGADANSTSLSGAVVGPSNKSVDEIAEAVADIVKLADETSDSSPLNSLDIIRLTSDEPADHHPEITYLDYHSDEDQLRGVVQHLRSNMRGAGPAPTTLGSFAGDATGEKHLLVFTTPTRFNGLINNFDIDMDSDESMDAGDWAEQGATFLDFLAVDESSMLQLPQLLQVGAFLVEDAQVLITGDHRQLPPIRTYEWGEETKRSIERYVPYLSALDYCRHLRGEDVGEIPDDAVSFEPNADIPVTRLEITYRCHRSVADFLQETVYSADSLEYRSERSQTLRWIDTPTDGLAHLLGEHPVSVVIHDETGSQMSNQVEAELIAKALATLDPSISAGVVTPHNAQRGLLESALTAATESEQTSDDDLDVDIDTVERFQGGEKDAIFLSGTVSSPDFIEAEAEFLLNPNRLNVAMSRMRRKLVIVASRTIFEHIPSSTGEYDDAVIWKALYREAGGPRSRSAWSGTLDELVDGAEASPDTRVDIYTLS